MKKLESQNNFELRCNDKDYDNEVSHGSEVIVARKTNSKMQQVRTITDISPYSARLRFSSHETTTTLVCNTII